MSGAATAGFRVGVPGEVEILVAKEDEPAALRVLAEAESLESDEEFDEADTDEDEE
jgi:hypothetical protein